MSDKKQKKKKVSSWPRLIFEIVLIIIIAVLSIALIGNTDKTVDAETELQQISQSEETEVETEEVKYRFVDDGVKFLKIEDGFFRPADYLTHAEMADMIYSLLGTDKVGTATFSDIDETYDCYKSAATLKTLGIISGARFHPEEPVTFEEFNDILSSFGQECEVSEQDMTRRDAAVIMSEILQRDVSEDFDSIGTIIDVSKSDEDFYIIADAALSETLPVLNSGYFMTGTTLRYIDEDGNVAANTTVDGFTFDGNGKITTGNTALDEVVTSVLNEVLVDTLEHPFHDNDGNLKLGDEYALKCLYKYVISSSKYVPNNFYDVGDISWAADEAYTMLTTHRGNCYNFASAFYVLARAIGYEAELYSGTMGPDDDPHSWVEIFMEGENKLFDPEIEYTQNSWDFESYFKRSAAFEAKYDYKKEVTNYE